MRARVIVKALKDPEAFRGPQAAWTIHGATGTFIEERVKSRSHS